MTSKPKTLAITLLAAIATGLLAILIYPLVFIAAVLVFAVGVLKRWRTESNYSDDDEFD
jgi:hydrogenase/urease accessory protein HupE